MVATPIVARQLHRAPVCLPTCLVSSSEAAAVSRWDQWQLPPSPLAPPVAGCTRYDLSDPFENRAGPFWVLQRGHAGGASKPSSPHFYLRVGQQHCNSGDIVHGGLLMTLADTTAAATASQAAGGFCVTVSCSNDFLGAVRDGDLLWSRADVSRRTDRIVFVRGVISAARAAAQGEGRNAATQDWRDVFTFSAVFSRSQPRL